MNARQPRARRPRAGHVALVGLLVVLHVLVAGPAPAQAHTGLVASSPRDGDTVSLRTDRLQLVFGEDLLPGSGQVVVRDVEGTDVVTATGGGPAVAGTLLEAPLDLRVTGPHLVSYRVVSVDGHAVVGELAFEVAQAGPAAQAVADATAPPGAEEGGLVSPVRWALVVAAALAAGVALLAGARRLHRSSR